MSNGGKFIKGAVIGAVAGFAAGILLAPKSGKETRSDIKKTGIKYKSASEKKLKALKADMSKKATAAKNKAKRLKGHARDEMTELAEAADIMKIKIDEALDEIQAAKKSQK